uniref:THAP-type domain-containing protein n=1 Tax=Myripristis murdjan TaxID=586833 RepID=A0A667YUR9_9TELE
MVKCMVPDCRNYSNPIRKKVFHRLPVSNPVLCKRWLIAISNPAVDPDSPLDPRQARSMFVCSDHFLPTDYILLPRRPLLKSTAVPSVFPHRLHALPGPVPEVRRPARLRYQPLRQAAAARSFYTAPVC